jgi:hypothetical protein
VMRFRVLDAGTADGLAAWTALWEAMPGREVMAHPEYALLFARACDLAVAVAGEDEGGTILFPLLLRPIAAEPWARPGERRWDATTPYGYGGPFAWGSGRRDDDAFWRAHAAWCRDAGIVSTFSRLSLFPERLASIPGRIEERGLNVVRRLGPDLDEVWRSYHHAARNNVRKAERAGLEVEVDATASRLDAFLRLYEHTMERRGASSWYHFPRAFFARLVSRLPGRAVLFHTVRGGEVLSSELVLCSDDHAYAFLSGTAVEAFPLRPNDLLRHRTVQWAIEQGKQAYVLGGGFAPGDGVFRHKLILAPQGAVPFRVAILHHDERACRELAEQRSAFAATGSEAWQPRAGFLPSYRA